MSRRMYRHTTRPPSRVIHAESRSGKLLEQNRVRLIGILAFFAFCFVMLSFRLIEVSLVGGGELPFKRLVTEPQLMLQMEEEETQAETATVLRRREITDRNGVVIATNVQTASLVANPTLIREPALVAQQLSHVLKGAPEAALREKLKKDTSFVYLKRHLSPAEQEKVNALGVPGLFFEPQDRRIYPFGTMASHILGMVDIDNRGLTGIEKFFDKQLEHRLGEDEPLALSMDIRLQSILHNEISSAMKNFSAIGGTGVVMDVTNGEVLAMVSLPSFDPHDPLSGNKEARFNRASLGAYEMGSTFKTFTVAMALNEGIIGVQDGYDASRPIRAAGYTINDYHPVHRWLSVREIYAYSSNIGTVKMALDVGAKKQREFLKSLGMFEPVNIELPERAQPLIPAEWKELTAMTISYGHGLSVSPLHLVQGVAAMANGGMKYSPTLVKQKPNSKPKGIRVIDEKTSIQVRELMRDVVEFGTARKANVAGFHVGGKTGTAEKIVDGRYKGSAKLSSFVSVFPTNNPKYLVYVMIDEPKGTKATYGYATGGWVAAPAVGNVISRMTTVLGMKPHFEMPDPKDVQFWAQADDRNRAAKTRFLQNRAIHAASY
jgi:cell division protein FtsI (penicillin-binding protein 3)